MPRPGHPWLFRPPAVVRGRRPVGRLLGLPAAGSNPRARLCGVACHLFIVGSYEGGGGGIRLSGVRRPHVTTVSVKAVFVMRTYRHPPPAHELGFP